MLMTHASFEQRKIYQKIHKLDNNSSMFYRTENGIRYRYGKSVAANFAKYLAYRRIKPGPAGSFTDYYDTSLPAERRGEVKIEIL